MAAKIARKRAEEDMKLLNNRIGLLKQEEQKAWKKIDETKKRAMDIVTQRERNYENQLKKVERQKQRDEEEQMRQAYNKAEREDQVSKIAQTKHSQLNKVKTEVESFK